MKNNNDLSPLHKIVVGAQFLFVAFGATVLVPLLVGLDPSVALLTAGLGDCDIYASCCHWLVLSCLVCYLRYCK